MNSNDDFYDVQSDIDVALADPARRARIDAYTRENSLVLALYSLREALGLTQEDFASAANMSQENLSRIERSVDVKFSTIERLIRAGGAEIELTAVLKSGDRVELLAPRSAVKVKAPVRQAARQTSRYGASAVRSRSRTSSAPSRT